MEGVNSLKLDQIRLLILSLHAVLGTHMRNNHLKKWINN